MSTSLIRFDSFTKYMASQDHVLLLVLFSIIDNISVKLFSIIQKKIIHYDVAFTMTFVQNFQVEYCHSLEMSS